MGNTLTAVVDRIIDLVYRRDFEYAELQGGWVALFCGLWLVVAWDAAVTAAVKTLITDFKSELQAVGAKAG